MPSLEHKIEHEPWDDLWGDLVHGVAFKLERIDRIEAFRRETEHCKRWIRSNASSLKKIDAGRISGLIRSTFDFKFSGQLLDSVVTLALKELGKLPLNSSEAEAFSVRCQVFDKTLN